MGIYDIMEVEKLRKQPRNSCALDKKCGTFSAFRSKVTFFGTNNRSEVKNKIKK